MKILYTNFHCGDGGGHTTYVLNLARALAGRHTISIAAPESSRLYASACQVPELRAIPISFARRMSQLWGQCARLRTLLERESFDIVHVNGSADHRQIMLSMLTLRGHRPRIVYTKHNSFSARTTGNALRARLATDRVVCVSDYTRQSLESTPYLRCGLRIVRNGVDTDHYAPFDQRSTTVARQRWLPAVADDAILIGSNAGTPDYKGWIDMVKAVAGLPPELRRRVFVLLAGELPTDEQRARVDALGMSKQVVFTGILADVRPFIAALDVGFVLSHQETISFACREMMSMGKPVLISHVGGLPENVSPGVEGWIVPPRSPARVAAVLRGILADPTSLPPMGSAARRKSEREFSLGNFVLGTEAIYQELVEA